MERAVHYLWFALALVIITVKMSEANDEGVCIMNERLFTRFKHLLTNCLRDKAAELCLALAK